jgi:hypothetical protein
VRVNEGRAARQHLVEQHADAVEVARRPDRQAETLLGRHVARRADDEARLGRGVRARHLGRGRQHLGDAEVEHADAVLVEHDVRGLEVAVDDAERVGFRQHVADFGGDPHGALGREGALARESLGQRRALHVLHDDEGAAVGEASCVEDHRGARVLEAGHRPRLAHEAFGHLGVGGELLLEDLDGDGAF